MTIIDDAFWHDKWTKNQIGFNQAEFHPSLTKHWSHLGIGKNKPVFVPLCGKSVDMVFLQKHGHHVFGIELSEKAIKDFSHENQLTLTRTQNGKFIRFSGNEYNLFVGDYFDLEPKDLRNVKAVYDRAALIALPQGLRIKYVSHLQKLLQSGTEILLITISYDQSKISGPPFNISSKMVENLFGDWCNIEQLECLPPEDFRGIQAQETVYRLTVK
ncbi:MAG: thiopurine S-methyltransferase [Robiginitomaculum sp.]|nr:thiopurine S-methyltransferase [Robiginitomaculum sp.]